MFLNTLDVKLSSRTGIDPIRVDINENTLAILNLVFEFRLASNTHIARFLTSQDQSKYLYRKLRHMWQAGFLESFKVFSGHIGFIMFYVLSKKGLNILMEAGKITSAQLKVYPKAKSLLSWSSFKHEAQIVELASLESKNNSEKLKIFFLGEQNSLAIDTKDDKSIEVLTPDYTVLYNFPQNTQIVYTEFERTKKSNLALQNKLKKYLSFFAGKDFVNQTLRFIFQTQSMEQAFWLNTILNEPMHSKLNILTTNLTLLRNQQDFLAEKYASENCIYLNKQTRLKAEITKRIKLFEFL